MDSVRELLGSEYGAHLNWPAFTKVDDTVGFVTRVYPGIKENAAIFSHPNAWPIIAEAILGRGDEAVAFYDSILPYNQNDQIEVRGAEPYAYVQFVYGRDHEWSTAGPRTPGSPARPAGCTRRSPSGSSACARPRRAGGRPVHPAAWDGFEVRRQWRGATYLIEVRNPEHVSSGVVGLRIDGIALEPGSPIEPAEQGATVSVEVVLGVGGAGRRRHSAEVRPTVASQATMPRGGAAAGGGHAGRPGMAGCPLVGSGHDGWSGSAPWATPEVVVCVDVGSTFTKAAAIDGDGRLVAGAEVPTTSDGDVLTGLDAAVAALGVGPVPDDALLVCSSAGGGLRLAVVGQERIVSVEAGRRVALSAGARVVGTWAGPLTPDQLEALSAAAPDVVLLVGGTDGGDPEILLHNAEVLGRSGIRAPVVVAGNASVAEAAVRLVRRGGRVGLLGRQRPAPDRGARPRLGTFDHSRGVHRPRHRWQGPVPRAALRPARQMCHP